MTNYFEESRYYKEYPMHHVASLGSHDLLLVLIRNTNHINERNYDGVTPLHEACVNGHYTCVEQLLNYGAEVNARNIDSSTPLCDASASGCVEILQLLLSHGAEVNPQSSSFTPSPLHEAVLRGNAACIRVLIEAGADVEAHDCHYGTPLHVACFNESISCAQALLDAGANVDATKTLKAPLHYAAESGCIDMVHLLLDYAPNIYATDNRNRTAARVAWENKNYDIWQMLKEAETNVISLLMLCRRCIRAHVKYRRSGLDALPLPPALIQYLHTPQLVHL